MPSKVSDRLNTKAILLRSENAYASYAKAMQKFYPIKYENYNFNKITTGENK